MKKVFVITGEHSGDMHAGRVVEILKSQNTELEVQGLGGENLKNAGATEAKICTMLLKPEAYTKDVALDYVAMEIPNEFIVGFGLDYDELGRNLKDIYVLDI